MAQGPFLRKYGVATTINFHLFETDGVDFKVDAVDGGADCTIMKDEGAEATCTNDFVDEGTGYSLALTATEMQAARIVVYVIDATATKVWLDTAITIETYGNASAQHAVDLDDTVRAGLTALPNAAADAAGGLPISDAGGLDLDSKLANTNEVTVARMGALTDWINGGRLDLILDAIAADVVNIDGAAMRGTDNAALASVLGALADTAAAGDPTSADTVMQYLKQIVNTLEGTTGIPTYPAAADPANNVSIAEAIRAIRDDVTGLNGDAMRGTDSASTHGDPDPGGLIANLDAAISTRSSHSAADVWTSGTRTLTSFGTLITDIWHHLLSAITTASTIGKLIKDNLDAAITTRSSHGDPDPSGFIDAAISSRAPETGGNVAAIKAKTDNLPSAISKNTALNNFEFLMVDSTDDVTPKTGLTVSGERSIDGAAFGACANAVTEVANGIYKINLAAADLNGDVITFRFSAATANDRFITIKTVAA